MPIAAIISVNAVISAIIGISNVFSLYDVKTTSFYLTKQKEQIIHKKHS